ARASSPNSTLCTMRRHGSSRSFCSMKPTVGFGPSTATPLSRMRPSLGRSRPATRLRIVLLPQPDGPTTATNSPARTSRLTRSMATSGDTPSGATKRLVTPTRSSTDAIFSISGVQRSVDGGELLLQHRGGPGSGRTQRPLHATALQGPGDRLEVLLAAAEHGFQRIGEPAFLGTERTAQRLMLEAGVNIAHAF